MAGPPEATSRSLYCLLSTGSNFPHLPLRLAHVKLRSLCSVSVMFLRISLDTLSPFAFDSPMCLPVICLQLIWLPTLIFPAAYSLWSIWPLQQTPLFPASFISYFLRLSTVHVKTFACHPSLSGADEASRQLGAGLLSLTNNDASPLSLKWSSPCCSEGGLLNHHLTISETNGVKACRLLPWTFNSLPCLLRWPKGMAEQTSALFHYSSHELLSAAVPSFFLRTLGTSSFIRFSLSEQWWWNCYWRTGRRSKAHWFNISKYLFLSVMAWAVNHFCTQFSLCEAFPLIFPLMLISTDLQCFRIKHLAKVKKKAFRKNLHIIKLLNSII